MNTEIEREPKTQACMKRIPPGGTDVLGDEQSQPRYKLVLGKILTFPEGRFGHQIAYFFFAYGDEAARRHIAERLSIEFPFNQEQFRKAGGWRAYRIEGNELVELSFS